MLYDTGEDTHYLSCLLLGLKKLKPDRPPTPDPHHLSLPTRPTPTNADALHAGMIAAPLTRLQPPASTLLDSTRFHFVIFHSSRPRSKITLQALFPLSPCNSTQSESESEHCS